MNDEPTGPCPLNCRRTARPVRYSFFFINCIYLLYVCMLGLSVVISGWEMVTCE